MEYIYHAVPRRMKTRALTAVVSVSILVCMLYLSRTTKKPLLPSINELFRQTPKELVINYTILWMHPPFDTRSRPEVQSTRFDSCEYSNCHLTFNKLYNATCDAVIFDGRSVGPSVDFQRPVGQVWIFAEHESPAYYWDGPWKRPPWSSRFNWTMTYDVSNTDIYLPYGEVKKRPTATSRNYTNITMSKTDDILMINSHCNTQSKRERFVSLLKTFIPVKVLGHCGEKWNCGRLYIHDDVCFQLLNTTYRFFLAFENSLCHQYFTEKYFDNFNYDIIMITRGGSKNETAANFPKGTYISTDDFDSIKSLAKYLKRVSGSVEAYTELLRRKDMYYSVGYKVGYQRAMCDICKRMNNQNKYRQTIPDMMQRTCGKKPCRDPDDIK